MLHYYASATLSLSTINTPVSSHSSLFTTVFSSDSVYVSVQGMVVNQLNLKNNHTLINNILLMVLSFTGLHAHSHIQFLLETSGILHVYMKLQGPRTIDPWKARLSDNGRPSEDSDMP